MTEPHLAEDVDWSPLDAVEIEGTDIKWYDSRCNLCKENIQQSEGWYHGGVFDWDFHVACWRQSPKPPTTLLTPIDRTEGTNPKSWTCRMRCGKSMGGGDRWYCNTEFGVDVCLECFPKVESAFIKVDVTNPDQVWSNRGMNPLLLDRSSVSAEREVPLELAAEVTTESPGHWADCVGSLVEVAPGFGSVKQWAMLKNASTKEYVPETIFGIVLDENYKNYIYGMPVLDVKTFLLVDCHEKTRGRIASGVVDGHGRVAVNIIYEKLADFLTARAHWNKEKQNDTKIEELQKTQEQRYSRTHNELVQADLADICTEFSGFIRMHRELNIYVG